MASHDVPETIQDVMVSRLDRLPGDLKRIVQTAAVIGVGLLSACCSALWRRQTALMTAFIPSLDSSSSGNGQKEGKVCVTCRISIT